MAGSVSFAEEIIHQEKSLYRNIIVKESRNRRCLVFSVKRQHRNQTCMDLKDPKRVVFPYVRMTFAGLLVNPEPQKTLMIGLGGGTISKILMELYPDMSLDLVEVDAAVVMVAKNYFGFEESGRTKVHITDGRVFTRRALIRGLKYDLIILDAFTGEYIPEHLMTQEFLTEVKSLLAPGGVVVANTFATSALYDHESVTYSSVFGDFLNLKMPGTGNRVILAVADQLPNGETLSVNAQRLSPLLAPYSVSITGFPRYLARKPDWDQDSRILTDQFAPVNLLRGEPRSHPSKGGSE
jgi:spermidine synthase